MAPKATAVELCSPTLRAPMSRAEAESMSHLIKAVADPARIQLLSLLKSSPDGSACVCDLTEPLGLSQPTVSHHLKVLVDAGLVTRTRQGTWAWYELVPKRIAEIRDFFR